MRQWHHFRFQRLLRLQQDNTSAQLQNNTRTASPRTFSGSRTSTAAPTNRSAAQLRHGTSTGTSTTTGGQNDILRAILNGWTIAPIIRCAAPAVHRHQRQRRPTSTATPATGAHGDRGSPHRQPHWPGSGQTRRLRQQQGRDGPSPQRQLATQLPRGSRLLVVDLACRATLKLPRGRQADVPRRGHQPRYKAT